MEPRWEGLILPQDQIGNVYMFQTCYLLQLSCVCLQDFMPFLVLRCILSNFYFIYSLHFFAAFLSFHQLLINIIKPCTQNTQCLLMQDRWIVPSRHFFCCFEVKVMAPSSAISLRRWNQTLSELLLSSPTLSSPHLTGLVGQLGLMAMPLYFHLLKMWLVLENICKQFKDEYQQEDRIQLLFFCRIS